MQRRSHDSRIAAPAPIAWRAPGGAPWTSRQLALLLLAVALATALRLLGVEQWSFVDSEVPVWQGVAGAGAAIDRQPFVVLLLRFLLAQGVLPLADEVWLRLPFVFVGITVVPLVALVGRRLLGDTNAAVAAAACCAVHPWFVAASQTAQGSGFAVAGALGALAAVPSPGAVRPAWRWAAVAACVLLAVGSHAAGWLVLPMLATVWSGERWPDASRRARSVRALALLLAPLLPAIGLPWSGSLAQGVEPSAAPWTELAAAFGWPTLGLAAAALAVLRPLPAPAAAAAVAPFATVLVAWCAGVPIAAGDLVVLLPLPTMLAAAACWRCFHLLRTAVAADGRAEIVASALLLGALLASLLVDSVLFLTVDDGRRPRCREAAALVARTADGPRGVLVAAAGTWSSLLFYLRRNHWSAPSLDPHPGRRVERLDLARPAASLRELEAAARGAQVVLVLRQDEVPIAEADPALRERLRTDYALAAVLETPFGAGRATLWIYRPVAP